MVNGRALPEAWKPEVRLINETLERNTEDFVYMGGVAVSVLYSERATKDIDVVARSIIDQNAITRDFEERGWRFDRENSDEERSIFWKELVKGYQNALEIWNNHILEKEFDDLVWERKRKTALAITRTVEVIVPTASVEDIIASKVGHEGIKRDDRIDVINLLNIYWKTMDYEYLKKRLVRWDLYEVFAPELKQTQVLPGFERIMEFDVSEVIEKLG